MFLDPHGFQPHTNRHPPADKANGRGLAACLLQIFFRDICYPVLRNSAAGTEIELPGRISAGVGTASKSPGRRAHFDVFPNRMRPDSGQDARFPEALLRNIGYAVLVKSWRGSLALCPKERRSFLGRCACRHAFCFSSGSWSETEQFTLMQSNWFLNFWGFPAPPAPRGAWKRPGRGPARSASI